jgi:dienelactone hydrolase
MLTSQLVDYETRTIAATVHGRYLVRSGPPERLLVGFHGYAENAERHIAELTRIPGLDKWTVAAVQALHPFYLSRTQEIVASWMTRQERELAIADNKAYVRSVVSALPRPGTLVFLGFSQGTAMAYRAAADHRSAAVIVLGGDVPPEVTAGIPAVLIGRGTRDDWYTQEKFEKDLKFLKTVTNVTPCLYDGAHEWTDEFRAAAAEFLQRL